MALTCMFWNVQRLFEPVAGKVARELGVSSSNWTMQDYRRKVANVAECMLRITDGVEPAFIGLAEVESLRVVQDLIAASGWNNLISVDEVVSAPELNGLDVALVYNRAIFKETPVSVESLTLNNLFDTRDLLKVRLRMRHGGTEVLIFVVHWPSRVVSEGLILRQAHSFNLRALIRQELKFSKADIVNAHGVINMPPADELLQRWNTPCIIVGDFNDEPFDASVRDALETTRFAITAGASELKGKALIEPANYLRADFSLFNPSWDLRFMDSGERGGTYYRSPEWKLYDQVIVSHGLLLNNAPLQLNTDSVRVPRVAEVDTRMGAVKMVTRNGLPNKFSQDNHEGVSDHLPIVFNLEVT